MKIDLTNPKPPTDTSPKAPTPPPPDPLAARLARASASAEALNEESTKLNDLYLAVTERLNAMKLSVRDEVNVDGVGVLSYCKWDVAGATGWMLVLTSREYSGPLTSAPRASRIASASFLLPLIEKLIAKVDEESKNVRGASAKLEAVIRELSAR
jgi:hypothetical protein